MLKATVENQPSYSQEYCKGTAKLRMPVPPEKTSQ